MYRNALIIKPGAMGDLLHLTPTVRALRSRFPGIAIDVMVGNRASVELFRHNPDIRDILVFDRFGEHRTMSALLEFCRGIRGRHYDLVINFQRRNWRTWAITAAALPSRVLVYRKTRFPVIHAVDDHLKTVFPLGVSAGSRHLDFYVGEEDASYASALFRESRVGMKPVALNLGASNRIKCWSPESFAALSDRLAEQGVSVVLVGGDMERDLADELLAKAARPVLDLTGRLNIGQLGAVLQQCAVLVSGDTGPLHLATAVGTPVVALFGAIDPDRTGPVGEGHVVIRHAELACVPCNGRTCRRVPYLECMQLISLEEVLAAVSLILDRPGEGS